MKNTRLYLPVLVLAVALAGCSMSEKSDSGISQSGKGGSLARFTISGDYLYTVDQSSLHTISLADAEHPLKVAEKSLGIYTETIYPYQNSLLLGTETGMLVYDISNPASPQKLTFFQHIRSCDPVVAQNGFAYITLNTLNQRCFNGTNQLQIVDISNLNSPQEVKTIGMTNPLGLDIDNDTLYVCDQGLRIFNVADKQNPKEIKHIFDIQANDVIHQPGRVIVIGTDGLHQYKQTAAGLLKISTIPIQL